MHKIAPGRAVRRLHAAALPPVPHAPRLHPLELLAERAADRLAGCTCTLVAGCFAPAMLMVELPGADATRPLATWLVSVASPTAMRLEAMVDEVRLDLLAEGPPDRILTRLAGLLRRADARAKPEPTLARP